LASGETGNTFSRRIVDWWVPDRTGRSYIVIAGHAAMLWAVITTQAILDLAFEFADWHVEGTATVRWWATWRSPGDGGDYPIACEMSPVRLVAKLREYAASGELDGRRRVCGDGMLTDEPAAAGDQAVTLDDVRAEVGKRWSVAPITGGYRAVARALSGTPIPRYGRTPAELLESIRNVER
jgi:hypothetical protein